MHPPLVDIVDVRCLADHRLRLQFEDGVVGEVDVARLVTFRGVFAPLRDLDYFRRVRVDPELGTICWPNEADFDPGVLYESLENREHHPELAVQPESPEAFAPGTESTVPEICRFLGIVIQMYFSDHLAPHFHAEYAGKNGVFDIATLEMKKGSLPPRVRGLVVEWASLHREELADNWERARRGDKLRRIAPLE